MEIHIETRKNKKAKLRRLALEGELNIYAVATLKDKLLAPIDSGAEVEMDLARVSDIDSAGLQLLILAKRHAATHGASLRLVGHSRPVQELLELYNLAAWFGDPLVIPAGEMHADRVGGRP